MRSACRAEFHQNACTCCAEIRNVSIYTYRLGNRRMQRSHRDLPCCNRVFSVHVAPQKTLRCSLSAYDGHLAEHRRLHLSGEAIHILGRAADANDNNTSGPECHDYSQLSISKERPQSTSCAARAVIEHHSVRCAEACYGICMARNAPRHAQW